MSVGQMDFDEKTREQRKDRQALSGFWKKRDKTVFFKVSKKGVFCYLQFFCLLNVQKMDY